MKKIAIIFDFDETLVEESTSAYLESLDIDINEFWGETVQELLDQDWDPVPAYMYKMLEYSFNDNNHTITKQSFEKFAKQITYKPGVKELFSNLRTEIKNIDNSVSIDFYIISSGIGELIRNTEIAKEFNDIWASDFSYDKKGEIVFPKKILSFTDKTRYIFQISKGMTGKKYRNKPYVVNEKVDKNNYSVPIENMIYIGDGLTDIPCFSLIKGYGGTAIAVYDAQNMKAYGKAWTFVKDNRVSNLHSANFAKGSDLYNTILMAVNEMINR
jgi:HAD superfamily phosphoserine phosphatase-like hydrolase